MQVYKSLDHEKEVFNYYFPPFNRQTIRLFELIF